MPDRKQPPERVRGKLPEQVPVRMTAQSPIDSLLQDMPEREESETHRLRQAIEEIFSSKDISLKSNLESHQIAQLIRAKLYAERFDSKMMRLVIAGCLEYNVSKRGGGRKDLRSVLQAMMSRRQFETEGNTKLQDRLLT